MTGYFAGVVQAPMTAFVIIIEMTGNQTNVVPVMLTALLALALRALCRASRSTTACRATTWPKRCGGDGWTKQGTTHDRTVGLDRRRITRRIWFRAGLFSLLGVVTALLGTWASPFIPLNISTKIGSDAVEQHSRHPGVVDAHGDDLLAFDHGFGLFGGDQQRHAARQRPHHGGFDDAERPVDLHRHVPVQPCRHHRPFEGTYGERGRAILFGVTILVIVFIIVTLLRWIDHLSRLGRVTETTQRVEEARFPPSGSADAARISGQGRCSTARRTCPTAANRVASAAIGYIQHIDVEALSEWRTKANARVFVLRLPGELADPTQPIAAVDGGLIDEAALRDCFTIGDRSPSTRTRASASASHGGRQQGAVARHNDLGTAVDVISRLLRVLAAWVEPADEIADEIDNVFVPPLRSDDLFDDAFLAMARDGARRWSEVGTRLQKALLTLSRLGNPDYAEAARRHSREAWREPNWR